MDKQYAVDKLQGRLQALKELNASDPTDPEFKRWQRDTEIALQHLFGENSRHVKEFQEICFSPRAYSSINAEAAFANAFQKGE
ncbi:MAG: hypothetical protein ACOC6S_00385 [Chloroflexota bacterium]